MTNSGINMRSLFRCIIATSLIALGAISPPAWGYQEPADQANLSLVDDRDHLDRQFIAALRELALWCTEQQRNHLAELTLQTYLVRDPGRLYVFLPTASEIAWPEINDDIDRLWKSKLETIRGQHADALFHWARTAATAGLGREAFQAIHETLYWNPNHDAARSVLGHKKTTSGWQPYSERLRIKPAGRVHPLTRWPKGSYLSATTDNFNIASMADEETTRRLAEQLQRWQWVWRQVFFEYWSDAKVLDRWLDSGGQSRGASKRFDVVFFASRQDYLAALSAEEPGIERSTGYYSDARRVSFFYNAPDREVEETWRHELTHQLFKESVRTDDNPFDEGFLWLGEGIAMYMESLLDFGSFATLGGFDARRLQYARTRQFREDFQIPLSELNSQTKSAFQQHPDIRRLYSQAAGLSHFLMHADSGKYRRNTVELLTLLYRGRFKADQFDRVLDADSQQLDQLYPQFLGVRSETVAQYLLGPSRIRELVLPDANLSDEAFAAIGSCGQLELLDITGSTLTADRARGLARCSALQQLLMPRSSFESGALERLQSCPRLQSLDLSFTPTDIAALEALQTWPALNELWLTGCRLDDSAIPLLEKMSRLQSVNLVQTGISPAGLERLRSARPDLTIVDQP